MELGSFSESAQEEINSLFGKEPAPTSEPEASADVEEEVKEVEEDEVPSKPDEDADEASSDEDDSETEETQTTESDIEYIKAGGKKVKIDYSDRENIKRVYAMAAGARQWQAERDVLRVDKEQLVLKNGELQKTMDYLEGIKDDHEELFEAVTGVKLNDKFQQWAEEQNLIGAMSDSEKEMYLSNQDHQKRIKEVESREKQLQQKLEDVDKRTEQAKEAQQTSIANPIFFKYNFDNELGNDQLEMRMNRTLWSEAKIELSQFDEITPDMVEETMKRISNQIRQGFKVSSDKGMKKAVTNKRKVVKAKAQKLAVAEPKDGRRAELDAKLKEGDLAGILAGGFDLSNY